MASDHFIGIDWGSTNARAFLFDAAGHVLELRDHALGLKHVAAGKFPDAFEHMAGAWRKHHGAIPTFLSGMVGSRHGWREAPYVPCPATLTDLARALVPLPDVPHAWIVPGLRTSGARPDVMRGEELQLLGLGEEAASCDLVCLPGTHAKWIATDGRTVRDFETAMTGEIFAALTEHTLFAELLRNAPPSSGARDADADFLRGLERSAAPHALLHALFEFRAGTLLGQTAAASVRDLISGLLIGTEVRHIQPRLRPGAPVALVGAHALAARYALALRTLGFTPVLFDAEEITARGFAALAAMARSTLTT